MSPIIVGSMSSASCSRPRIIGTTSADGYARGRRLPGGGALNLAGGSVGAGTGQTALAARLAPPSPPVFDCTTWRPGGIAVGVALAISIIAAVCSVSWLWSSPPYRSYRAARVAWRAREARWWREVAVWETTSYCLRDDCVWIPGSFDWANGDETVSLIRSYVDMDASRSVKRLLRWSDGLATN